MDLNNEYTFDVEARLKSIIWIIGIFFLLVVGRLFYLQIIKGGYYHVFSENNSIRNVEIPAARGLIYDRNENVIVQNRPVFDLVIVPQYITDTSKLRLTLANNFGYGSEKLENDFNNIKKLPPFMSYVVDEDVPLDVVSKLRARRLVFGPSEDYNIDGLDIRYRYLRDYPEGDLAPHVLGYVREIDKGRLAKMNDMSPGVYKSGDIIGINGLEENFDLYLRGREGADQKIVDALGKEVTYQDLSFKLIERPAIAGGNLYLTLDMQLQKKARDLLQGKTGSVVALDPNTGAVLAIASSPSYDLNMLSRRGRNGYWASLIIDPERPLYNRSIQGQYPPASTFKIVTALAGLRHGAIMGRDTVSCHGGMQFGNRYFNCWKKFGHGPVDLVRAIAESCDVYFYNAGLAVGVDGIAETAFKLGLGNKTGIELTGEKMGLIPTEKWKQETIGQKWIRSETLSSAIGQGFNLVTPIQLARVGAAIANNGYLVKPYLVEKIMSPYDDLLYEQITSSEKIDGISDEDIRLVRNGLEAVVDDARGTAHALSYLKLKIAGKTGTAQVIGKEYETGKRTHLSHAWFVGYAPYDNPKIVVVAMIEHGEHGSSAAAPVVGEIIKTYLSEEKENARDR